MIPRPRVSDSAAPTGDQELVPVVCDVCQTRMYAKVSQIGSLMECPDCFTQTLVREPVKKSKVSAPEVKGTGYDLEPEEAPAITKSLGEDLLREADQEVERQLDEEPTIPDRPFLSGVLLYPFYWRIFPVVLGMVLAWTLVLLVGSVAWHMQAQRSLVAPFVIAAAGIVLLIVVAPTLVTLQKVFENTSNGDESTDCRPDGGLLAFIDWIGDVIPMSVAWFLSCAPAMTLLKTLDLPNEFYLVVAFSGSLFFPVVLLSILESASLAGVYSKAVWSTLRTMPGAWFKFYSLSTVMLVLSLAAIAGLAKLATFETTGLVVAGAVGCLLGILVLATMYFRLLGRLAFLFTQEVEVDEPTLEGFEPLRNEVDSELSIHV